MCCRGRRPEEGLYCLWKVLVHVCNTYRRYSKDLTIVYIVGHGCAYTSLTDASGRVFASTDDANSVWNGRSRVVRAFNAGRSI